MSRQVLFVSLLVGLALGVSVMIVDAQGPKPTPPKPKAPAGLPGTAFTYQGQLKNNGALVNGSCDFALLLFDASSSGNQVGGTLFQTIPITNGLFTTSLDFGNVITGGVAVWLGMNVRCPTLVGGYTPLSPRQALTPAPMAFALPGLYTQQNGTSPNIIGGYSGNFISPTVVGGTISGGGITGSPNRVWDNLGSVGGGANNTASGLYGTVGGGASNTASGNHATVGGGAGNNASGYRATIGGGENNTASGIGASVGGGGEYDEGGGEGNHASGNASTIPGGAGNYATMTYTLAAGQHANAVHQGAFIWADSSTFDYFSSTGNDQFLIRANGGVGVNQNSFPTGIASTLSVSSTAIDIGGITVGGSGSSEILEIYANTSSNYGGIQVKRPFVTSDNLVLQEQGGNVGIGAAPGSYKLDVSGKIHASSGFNGTCRTDGSVGSGPICNQDFAETFAATERTQAGDLVVLSTNSGATPTVRKSNQPYDGLLIGIVSQNPGLVFDNGETHLAGDNSQLITANKTVVALVGRVLVKVSIENGAIAVGDPLTSSSIPGVAMKATQAGKIIGYAMENASTNGVLLALIQPGYYLPADQLALVQQNAALDARLTALEEAAQTPNPSFAPLTTLAPHCVRCNAGEGGGGNTNIALALAIGALGVIMYKRTRA